MKRLPPWWIVFDVADTNAVLATLGAIINNRNANPAHSGFHGGSRGGRHRGWGETACTTSK